MLGIHDLPLFLASSLLLNLMPGPDSLLVMLRTGSQGWRAGLMAALGISSGVMVHVVCAALGLSALLAASAELFMLVKLVGALYLVYLGVTMLRQRRQTARQSLGALPNLWQIYRQGVLTNVLNPKVALFFLAFMPQFIVPEAPHKALAFVLLGTLFNISGTLWCLLLVWFTSSARQRIGLPTWVKSWLQRAMGGLFVLLGIRLATQ